MPARQSTSLSMNFTHSVFFPQSLKTQKESFLESIEPTDSNLHLNPSNYHPPNNSNLRVVPRGSTTRYRQIYILMKSLLKQSDTLNRISVFEATKPTQSSMLLMR